MPPLQMPCRCVWKPSGRRPGHGQTWTLPLPGGRSRAGSQRPPVPPGEGARNPAQRSLPLRRSPPHYCPRSHLQCGSLVQTGLLGSGGVEARARRPQVSRVGNLSHGPPTYFLSGASFENQSAAALWCPQANHSGSCVATMWPLTARLTHSRCLPQQQSPPGLLCQSQWRQHGQRRLLGAGWRSWTAGRRGGRCHRALRTSWVPSLKLEAAWKLVRADTTRTRGLGWGSRPKHPPGTLPPP